MVSSFVALTTASASLIGSVGALLGVVVALRKAETVHRGLAEHKRQHDRDGG